MSYCLPQNLPWDLQEDLGVKTLRINLKPSERPSEAAADVVSVFVLSWLITAPRLCTQELCSYGMHCDICMWGWSVVDGSPR